MYISRFQIMYRVMSRLLKSTSFVLVCGFVIGFMLGVLFIETHFGSEKSHLIINKTRTAETNFQGWLHLRGLERQCVSSEDVSYGNFNKTESNYMTKHINVLCVVFVSSSRKVETIMSTWGKHCNNIMFFGISDFQDSKMPISVIKPKSSWHYLCSAILQIWLEHEEEMQWVLFTPDSIFAIPENLRLVVSSLDHSIPYYLGHALYLWGETYNAAQAGYALSKAAIEKLATKFDTPDKCEKSGKHWKNEDFYLGKYLGEMEVFPIDTRDHLHRGRFHAYNFNQLLFSRKLSPLSSYWKRSIYPVIEGKECCSATSVTFHGVEEDKVHQFYYLLYRLKSFQRGGYLGNQPAPTSIPETEVWRRFLLDEGILDDPPEDMSAEQFFELTRSKVMSPNLFNQALKQEAGGK